MGRAGSAGLKLNEINTSFISFMNNGGAQENS
jgi:hypothetical protein